eukprot:CAMPEP_0176291510 /NCGR_PEP_ID=MMETSP0121_2-20121125/55584_1 /TAXON_ID=160619 /ORGANISM="Kryptoperidinium foliaceum, Strain CCMP 1326" /LENGTH=68 /DNA_ID=CAMNT_0017632351 /DNA_START=44 /DNA_END=250 /DNA_ORIENTATION=+
MARFAAKFPEKNAPGRFVLCMLGQKWARISLRLQHALGKQGEEQDSGEVGHLERQGGIQADALDVEPR